jgi:CheY-like chemotaxis protein
VWYGRQMVEQAGALPGEAETPPTLSDSRAQFVASLGRRLEALREALTALQQAPRSAPLRDQLRRRIHAFGAAAGVLGFEKVFEAFREAESVLGRSGPAVLGAPEIGLVARTLDLVPSLVLGAAAPAVRPRGGMERRGGAFPTSVLVFGATTLAESLSAAAAGSATLECERTEDAERAEEIVRVTAPDVAVIDADRPGARELMETLTFDPLLDPVRIIAVGTFDRPEAAATLVALGVARVLPKPVSPDALKRSVLEVSRERTTPIHRNEPIGDATIELLADRLAQEIRRGLVDAVKPEGRGLAVSLGEGADVLAAVWSSVARIRELVTLRSGGAVRFETTGPEGAVPLAPWMRGDEQPRAGRGTERRTSDGVSLKGRTIVVVDDDPSVVWFLSGLLRATGAEVLEAHDGIRALALVRERWPDLVVSDILMPGLDGFALCREIKRDVALADVPVILLSWKEDLLQRARELGADADGYLRKEATASVVVQRAREVLLPRARVEARVTAGGEVRGRLDGLTPRLILEIACRHGRNAHVTIRDAAFLYEVDVRDGQVRTATRTASDGHAETGEGALSGLLGVRAGRFAVRPDETECVADWGTDLRDLLKAPVERARAAQGLLAKIERIARIELDTAGLEPYLAASPHVARAIVQKLAGGESPAATIASGISARLFEAVLVDVILHGAVSRIVGTGGEDLLAGRPPSNRPLVSPRSSSATNPVVASPRHIEALEATSAAVSQAALPVAPAAVSAGPSVQIREAEAPDPAVSPAGTALPPSSSTAMPSPATADVGGASEFAAFFLESVVPPAPTGESSAALRILPMKALAPPTSAPPEPSPLETALRSLPAPSSSARREESPRPKNVTPVPVAALVAVPPPEAAGAGPITQPGGTAASVAGEESGPSLQPPAVTDSVSHALPPTVREGATQVEPATVKEGKASKPPAEGQAPAQGTREGRSEVALSKVVDAGKRPEDGPAVDLGAAVISALEDETPGGPARAGADVAPPTPPERAPVPRASSEREARRTTQSKTPLVDAAPPPSSVPTVPPSRGPSSIAPGPGGSFGVLVVVCVAAVASYALVTAVRGGPDKQPDGREIPIASVPPSNEPVAPKAAAAPAPVGAVVALVGPMDLDLPAGITVERGKGLLEVDTALVREMTVDGVIVGTAPLRQIPLMPGSHAVRLRGEGLDLARTVDIHEGRRTRLGTTSGQ